MSSSSLGRGVGAGTDGRDASATSARLLRRSHPRMRHGSIEARTVCTKFIRKFFEQFRNHFVIDDTKIWGRISGGCRCWHSNAAISTAFSAYRSRHAGAAPTRIVNGEAIHPPRQRNRAGPHRPGGLDYSRADLAEQLMHRSCGARHHEATRQEVSVVLMGRAEAALRCRRCRTRIADSLGICGRRSVRRVAGRLSRTVAEAAASGLSPLDR